MSKNLLEAQVRSQVRPWPQDGRMPRVCLPTVGDERAMLHFSGFRIKSPLTWQLMGGG